MKGTGRNRRATIYDVARNAGVSAATVSKVLRGDTTVKPVNIERVQQAVAELGYRADPLAAGLRHERRRIIGAIVPDLENPFFGALVTGLERAAEKSGFHMIIASSRESEIREKDLINRLNDWRVAGTVLAPVRSERGAGAMRLHTLNMQAVLVDRVSANDHFDTVSANNFEASASVADFLIGHGHRHVLLHGTTLHSSALRTRADGFSIRARQLDPQVRLDRLLSDEDVDSQRSTIREYLDTERGRSGGPTAVFSLTQYSTLLVLSEIRRCGMVIPEQIEVIGFDDAEWMQTTWPSITAVKQPIELMATRAITTLLSRIEGSVTGYPVQYLEPCNLLVRQSAGQANRKSLRLRRGGQDS